MFIKYEDDLFEKKITKISLVDNCNFVHVQHFPFAVSIIRNRKRQMSREFSRIALISADYLRFVIRNCNNQYVKVGEI